MSSEKFCLKWNDFESNITTAFRELREEEDFFDVTLACEDNQIQAHKVILSACSPFFRNILKRNPHQHPLLYLKGVKYRELINIVAFIYRGEVSVSQEDLNSFLAVAEELHVKGLTQSEGSSSSRSKARNNPGKRPGDGGRGYGEPSKRAKHQQEDGETEEVMQVKSEPMLHARDTSATEIFDETQDYDYEGYDDGTNSVEQTSSYTSGLDKGELNDFPGIACVTIFKATQFNEQLTITNLNISINSEFLPKE